jgi:hypothetical protein
MFEDSGLLGCDTVSLGEWFPTFRRNLFPSFSRVNWSSKSASYTNTEFIIYSSNLTTCILFIFLHLFPIFTPLPSYCYPPSFPLIFCLILSLHELLCKLRSKPCEIIHFRNSELDETGSGPSPLLSEVPRMWCSQ